MAIRLVMLMIKNLLTNYFVVNMNKVLFFFKILGERTIKLFSNLKNFFIVLKNNLSTRIHPDIFKDYRKGLLAGSGLLLIIIIVFGLGWWLKTSFFDAKKDSDFIEAKVYIIGADKCESECWDTNIFLNFLESKNIKIVKKKNLDWGWWPFSQARLLAKKYEIKNLPTVAIEFLGRGKGDIKNFFSPDHGVIADDKFILTKIVAPYYNLDKQQIVGKLDIIYLVDNSCETCYDINIHNDALGGLGLNTKYAKIIDVGSSEGKKLIEQYKITKVPTVLISGEVDEYPLFKSAWDNLGIITDDNTYIFTNLDLMGDYYKNLTTGEVIKADPESAVTD